MPRIQLVFMTCLLSATFGRQAEAGFQVTAWNLQTVVQDGLLMDQDLDFQVQVTNPWHYTSLSQLGASFSQTDYDYSWLPEFALGTFHTGITQAIPSPEVRAIATGQVFILADEDLRVTVNGSMTYAHTPGDDTSIDFGMSIRDMSTNDFIWSQHHRGGNLYLLPAAGTLDIESEVILSAGTVYRLSYTIDSSNTADLLPTGTFDASGFTQFVIEPVIPEPASGLLFLAAAPLALRRRRRRR